MSRAVTSGLQRSEGGVAARSAGPLWTVPDWWFDLEEVVADEGEFIDMSLVRDDDLEEIRTLVHSAFEVPRFESLDYLRWLYTDSPFGPVFSAVARRGDQAISHLAGAPRRLRATDGTLDLWLITNVASRPDVRREGAFLRMCLQAWLKVMAFDEAGIYGVMNDQSRRALEAFGVVTECELPVRMLVPGPFRRGRFRSVPADRALNDGSLAELFGDTDLPPRWGLRLWWHLDHLRWRMASPLSEYTIHVGDGMTVITTTTVHRGVRVAALMKVFVTAERREAMELGTSRLGPSAIGELCAYHRVPSMVYVGYNSDVDVVGTRVPRRFLPAPLHLCFKAIPERVASSDLRFDTFELLDFDVL